MTSLYVYYNIYPIFLVYSLYCSNPWKEVIYRNYLLFFAILLNMGSTWALSFLTPQLKSFFSFTEVSYRCMAYIFMIAMIGAVLTMVYNGLVNSLKLHENTQRTCSSHKEKEEERL